MTFLSHFVINGVATLSHVDLAKKFLFTDVVPYHVYDYLCMQTVYDPTFLGCVGGQ